MGNWFSGSPGISSTLSCARPAPRVMTVLAISLGAPFWFDLLNRFMIVRGGGKTPDETTLPREEQPALGPGEPAGDARRLDAMRP